MTVRFRRGATAAAIGALVLLVAGCPLKFESAPGHDAAPTTYFEGSRADLPDTTFKNLVSLTWRSVDLDSDIAAYQFQLVQTDSTYYFSGGVSGRVLRSINPPLQSDDQAALDGLWSPRSSNNSQNFPDLEDGWYEARARGIDDKGVPSDPARYRFYVFFDDVPPIPVVVDPIPGTSTPACGRIPQTRSWTFWIDAGDSSRHAETPRDKLQYSYQLRARSAPPTCTTHLGDSFTEWRFFPAGNQPIEIGNDPPTQYSDLDDAECGWEFTLQVRDPAHNLSKTTCCISKTTGCQ
jgi:hypothetical protein